MQKKYENKYHELEENHWWFKVRRNIIFNLLKQYRRSLNAKIIDIGCSGGNLLQELNIKGYTNLAGVDLSKQAIDLCHSKGLVNTFIESGVKTNFPVESFDVVISSDILEHLEDENGAVKEWNRLLKSSGYLIIFVPAYKFLWCQHDVANMHYRRYSLNDLKEVLNRNGFDIVRISYWNFLLFFPTFILRMSEKVFSRKNGADQLVKFNPFINNILIIWVGIENRVLSWINLPLGVSVFAVARKHTE
jgi:SAM-dependent methyltransferase